MTGLFHDMLPLIPALLALGVFTGFSAGLLGIGGGVILVPGLIYILSFFGIEEAHITHMAIGTSLAIILPTGFSSALSHYKKGGLHPLFFKYMAPGILLGPILGVSIAGQLDSPQLGLIFALAIMVLAILMQIDLSKILGRTISAKPYHHSLAGFVVGAFSSLIGIGGATLNVPYMSLNGLDIRQSIGTAAALGVCIALSGAFGFAVLGSIEAPKMAYSSGYIYWPAWLCITCASALCAPLGARMTHMVPVKPMKKIFALFMLLVAGLMVWDFINEVRL